jgi:hypothetical protein
MRIVLRDVRSGEYFLAPDSWTRELDVAYGFESTFLAVNAALACGRDLMEVVLVFEDYRFNIALPVKGTRDGPRKRLD